MDESELDYIKPEYRDQIRDVDISATLKRAQDKVRQWADKIIVGGFYEKEPEIKREIGETWTDAEGTEWTVDEGGNKCTVKSLAMKEVRMPYWCPKCGGILDSKLHEKFWRMKGTCHNCVVRYEHKIRVAGLWPAYERRLLRENERSWLRDQMSAHVDYIETFKEPQAHYGDGRWETLADRSLFEPEFNKLRQDIAFIEARMEAMDKEEEQDADEQRKLDEWRRDNPWTTTPEE